MRSMVITNEHYLNIIIKVFIIIAKKIYIYIYIYIYSLSLTIWLVVWWCYEVLCGNGALI